MNVSAVILSAAPVARKIRGVKVVPHVSKFEDAAGLLDARIESLKRVDTDWFFWLDDTDDLPADYARVLKRCMAVETPLAYTDEMMIGEPGTMSVLRKSKPYSQDAHIDDMTLIHHLAVCRTEAALRAAEAIPRGCYGVENLLFFQVAKEGATYIDEVGYLWRRAAGGLSHHPSLLTGLVQSATWAHRNRT